MLDSQQFEETKNLKWYLWFWQDPVPVEAAYQVLRVARVLSMGLFYTDVQGVPEKSCQIKPWENFEKMQF